MDSRVILLTESAFKYGNLNLSSCGRDFFPPDVFGGSRKDKSGKTIILKIDGLNDTVETDIPTDKKTSRPRWMFRRRGWSKKFVNFYKLKIKDEITITRLAPRTYKISPNGSHNDLITIDKAAQIVRKTPHNIRDYIQRGRIYKYNEFGERISKANNGELRVLLKELKDFLNLLEQDRYRHHRPGQIEELGFYGLPEYERTKHVHRLHLYSGEFTLN